MWPFPHYVKEILANILNSRMVAQDWLALLGAYVRNEQPRSYKLLRSYQEVINFLLKKYAIDPSITEYDAAIFCYLWRIVECCKFANAIQN